MRLRLLAALLVLLVPGVAAAQGVPPPPTPSPLPAGMRVISGGQGVLVRNTPSLNGQCGSPPHECTTGDAVPPNIYGVIQSDPPVLDPSNFWWSRITWDFAGGTTGWSSVITPFVNMLTPVQMVQGSQMSVIGDYAGAALTQGICINDGVNSGAVLQLQALASGGVQGTLLCPWGTPGVGNHKAVIKAVNNAGTADSLEFQFQVTAAPVSSPPAQPQNLRIAPTSPTTTALKPPGAPGTPTVKQKED